MIDVANQQAGQPGDGLDDFESAVDAFTAPDSQAPADAAADGENGPVQEPASIEQPGSAKEAGNPDPAAAKAPAETQSTDIWANAPAELRDAYQRERADLEHRLRSAQGRLSAADRELAGLRNQSTQQRGAPEEPKPEDAEAAKRKGERLASLQEEYGDIVNPLLDEIGDIRSKMDRLSAPVEQLTQTQRDAAHVAEIDTFAKAHPDWQSYVSDARYPEWLSAQPKAVQDAAARAVNIEDGHEAAWLLSQFKASIGVGTSAPTTPEADPDPKPAADPRRARQLAAGRDGGVGASPPVQSGIPDDFDAATDAYIAKANRETSRKPNGQFA